jgi:hypothetical protein
MWASPESFEDMHIKSEDDSGLTVSELKFFWFGKTPPKLNRSDFEDAISKE